MITFSSCEWKSNKHFLKLWVMKIEHFFLMAGLGEVAHLDVDQLFDLLRKKSEWDIPDICHFFYTDKIFEE